MRQLIVVLGTFILYSFSANSQKLSGIVIDEQGKGLDKTTISLLRTKDSSVIKFSTTGNDGKFSIEATQGRYLISASHIGYTTYYSSQFELNGELLLDPVTLKKIAKEMQGVTITAQKPIIEVK
ncbi:MAG TPA: carboxypeptidase-like regulatory domain-containing protein, partial [Chitinophagaceae bacterium]|nr:carboxypeptidase-like regulatory domain-containing protein [Chitinophagaceae bacterium]